MKKKICMILIAVFVAILGTSTFFIIDHYKESDKQAELYGELADLVNAAAQTDAAMEPAEQIPYSEEKMLLPELAELYQQNCDLVGWISIADTNINYPVMQSVNEPNFYLKQSTALIRNTPTMAVPMCRRIAMCRSRPTILSSMDTICPTVRCLPTLKNSRAKTFGVSIG